MAAAFRLARSNASGALGGLLAAIDALWHEAQPNNSLGGEIQRNASPEDENYDPDDAVLEPVGPLNIEFRQDDPGSGDERHHDQHINDQKKKLEHREILTGVQASSVKHALPLIVRTSEAILQSVGSVIGLAGGAGVDPPGVGG